MFRIILLLLIILSEPLMAQESALVMTLEEALKIARNQQPDLLNARRNIAYAQAATREAKSSYLPKLTIEGDYRYNPIIQTNVLPANAFNPSNDPKDLVPIRFGTPWNGVFGIRLKQAIYDPAKLATVSGSKLAEDLAKTQEKRIQADREEEIVKAWYSLMLSRAKQEYYKTDRARYKSNELVISEQVQQGRALPNDLREAELKTLEAGIEEERIVLDIFSAQIYLSYMMGYDTVQLILPKESLTDAGSTDKILRGWELLNTDKNAIGVRPDVQEQKLNTQIAGIELQQAKAGRLPVLNFEGYLGANNFTYNFNPVSGYYGNSFLGLSLRYPIYGGGEKKMQVEQSAIQLEQQKENVRKLEQQAFYEIVNSANKVEYQAKQINLQQQRMKIQEEKITLVRTRLEAGRALPQDLLNEETRFLEIKKNYYQNLHDLLIANVEFRKASGKSTSSNQ